MVTRNLDFIFCVQLEEMRSCIRKLQWQFGFTAIDFRKLFWWNWVKIVDNREECIPEKMYHLRMSNFQAYFLFKLHFYLNLFNMTVRIFCVMEKGRYSSSMDKRWNDNNLKPKLLAGTQPRWSHRCKTRTYAIEPKWTVSQTLTRRHRNRDARRATASNRS